MAKSTKAKQSELVATRQTWKDAKNALLVVSLLANLFVLIGFAVLQLTSQYDSTIASAVFGR